MAQLECTKIYCTSRKAAILRCLSYPELHGISTTDPFFANDYLVPLGVITSDRLKKSVAGRVTGRRRSPSIPQGGRTSHISSRFIRPPNVVLAHSYSPACTSTTPSIASILAHLPHREFTYVHLRPARGSMPKRALFFRVPYSEHSSFFEPTCFALHGSSRR
jgi:DNA cross-link repair 1A protein